MTVAATPSRITFNGNGVSTVFAYPYYFQAQADIKALTYDTSTGDIVPLVLNVDFSISGSVTSGFGYLSGANVTIPGGTTNVPAVIPTGTKVVLYRDPALLQNLSLPLNGDYVPLPIESEADAEVLMMQRIYDLLSRAVRLKDGFAGTFDSSLPAGISLAANVGKLLGINALGTGLDLYTNDGSGGGGSSSAAMNIDVTDDELFLDATEAGKYFGNTGGGAFDVNLPSAALNSGIDFFVKNISFGGANALTVKSADSIEGAASDILGAGEGRTYTCNGITWYVKF